ncbi:MAG: lipid-A-disaccharide synthase [Bacteroidota bacterium]
MKYYILAGEASGDLHASKLMKGIEARDTQAEFRCWGGDNMQKAGGTIVKHYRDLAFMGFQEVLLNIRTISHNIKFCKNDIIAWNPDAVILVDYPGFNMRIAKFAKASGFKVIYYISPQVWAWKKHRVHALHRDTDLAFVVMPFEKEFHAKYGYHVEFTGHPTPDSMDLTFKIDEAGFRKKNQLGEKPIIALVPGSRKQELQHILPVMLQIIKRFSDYQFVITGVSTLSEKFYTKLIKDYPVKVVYDQTYDLLRVSRAAAVKSGTVTLETAMLGIPQVVCYCTSPVTAFVARLLVNVKFASLVNLILDRKAVTELIQEEFTADALYNELAPLLADGEARSRMLDDYKELLIRVGPPGASDRAAAIIVKKLNLLKQAQNKNH